MECMIFQSFIKQGRAKVRGDASKWFQYRNSPEGMKDSNEQYSDSHFAFLQFLSRSIIEEHTGGFESMHAFQGRQNSVSHT